MSQPIIIPFPGPGQVVVGVVPEVNGELTLTIRYLGKSQVQHLMPDTPGVLMFNPESMNFYMVKVNGILDPGDIFIQFIKEIQ